MPTVSQRVLSAAVTLTKVSCVVGVLVGSAYGMEAHFVEPADREGLFCRGVRGSKSSDYAKMLLRDVVSGVASEEWDEFSEIARELVENLGLFEKVLVVEALRSIDPLRRRQCRDTVIELCGGTGKGCGKIIRVLAKIAPEMWRDLVPLARSFVQGIQDRDERISLVGALLEVFKHNRMVQGECEAFSRHVSEIAKDLPSENKVQYFAPFLEIWMLRLIAKPYREEFFRVVSSLLESIKGRHERARVIFACIQVAPQHRKAFVEKACQVTQPIINEARKATVVECMAQISHDRLDDLVTSYENLALGAHEGYAALFKMLITCVAPQDWHDFAHTYAELMTGLESGYDRAFCIRSLMDIAPEARGECLAGLYDLQEAEQQEFMRALAFSERIQGVQRLLQQVQYNPSLRKKGYHYVLSLLNSVFRADRLALARAIVLSDFVYVDDDERVPLVHKVRQLVISDLAERVKTLCVEEAREVADYITKNFANFGLKLEDSLVQNGLRVQNLVDEVDHPKNPYYMFRILQKQAAQPVDYENLASKEERIGGCPVRLIPEAFKLLRCARITFDQLPRYSKTFLQDMKARLLSRIAQEQGLDEAIEGMTEQVLEHLYSGALEGNFLERLLQQEGAPGDEVSFLAAKFIAIVSFIEHLPDQRNGQHFSEREEAFLRMIASIRKCETGKAEGINNYYALVLPVQYKLPCAATLNGIEVPACISEAIRDTVESIFSCTTPFVRRLCCLKEGEKYENESGAHQEAYLKNLVRDEFPFGRDVSLDIDIRRLCTPLQVLVKQELLERIFSEELLPREIVDGVIRAINEVLAQGDNSIYARINEIFEEQAPLQRIWNVNEDPMTITQWGVVHLLKKLGIVRIRENRLLQQLGQKDKQEDSH